MLSHVSNRTFGADTDLVRVSVDLRDDRPVPAGIPADVHRTLATHSPADVNVLVLGRHTGLQLLREPATVTASTSS